MYEIGCGIYDVRYRVYDVWCRALRQTHHTSYTIHHTIQISLFFPEVQRIDNVLLAIGLAHEYINRKMPAVRFVRAGAVAQSVR